ncbi:peroxisomal biogenesis factor 11 [Schizosaccharomyces japonicus yFS275]|uniref:Peroxisomal biogenesis factor 11 n=1 Tax=Schizosaccharomyces japonicus (strain yFS275 / FY16936) TaxID=402676 RepID=B6K617_SCHJY|nr:peroxisomal biogenesis factor 11 [Schizosaccharomyces japonicus yFS275]EEB08971.2 peroxisomal biogenesis factor 11 [Schizosaccharomyces japonicus yFS275]
MEPVLTNSHLNHVLNLLDELKFRDKSFRALQFTAKLTAWYLYTRGESLDKVKRWKSIESQLSFARNFFTVGKVFLNLKSSVVKGSELHKSSKTEINVLTALEFFKEIANTGQNAAELRLWLNKTQILPLSDSKGYSNASDIFGLFSSMISATADAFVYYTSSKDLKIIRSGEYSEKGSKEESLKKVLALREKSVFDFVEDTLDCISPMNSLGLIHVDDHVIGLAGLVTSFMELYALWNKTKILSH